VSVDLGQGLFAMAQREILEVLLNEPKLFEDVKQKVTSSVFDVPILRQIATIVFEMLDSHTDVTLAEVLARADSVEAGKTIVELAQVGEEKGNFESRLFGAISTFERIQQQRKHSEIKTIEEQTRFLRDVSENSVKENPHSPGMV